MLFNGKRKFFLTLLAAVFCTGLHMNAMSKEYSVCIDPGHQGSWVDMSAPESIAPGSDQTKAKCTTGTTGKTTGVPEYQLNLDISLALEKELTDRGYKVAMTRKDNDTAISNSERALFASENGCDIAVRIHANGSDDTSVSGALAMVMSQNNPYVGNLFEESSRLATSILNSYCMETGFKNLGIQPHDDMTGLNWSKVPVMILEMGFMSNASDDTLMQDKEMQKKMVKGIADGIDAYFGKNGDAKESATEKKEQESEGLTEDKVHPEPAPEEKPLEGVASMIGKDKEKEKDKADSHAYPDEDFLADPLMSAVFNQYIAAREQKGQSWAVGFEKLVRPDAGKTAQTETGTEAAKEAGTEKAAQTEKTSTETEKKEENKGKILEYHGDIVMQSASVVKVFIMGAVYDRVLYPKDEAHKVPYNGDLTSLLQAMITVSDNDAANRLIEVLGEGNFQKGAEVMREFCMEYGYVSTSIGRRFMESKPTGDNYTSVSDCRKILSDIYYGKCVNKEASEKMLGLLKGQKMRNKIPAGLPAGFSCANKTGEMPEGYGLGCIENDLAIVFGPEGDYVLCVLSNNLGGDNVGAQQNIAAISSYVANNISFKD